LPVCAETITWTDISRLGWTWDFPRTNRQIPIHLLFYTGATIANTALHICYGVFKRRGFTIKPTRHHDTSMDSEELYDRGVAQRQLIMGDHIAGGLEESGDSVDPGWRRYLTEYFWGAVWARPFLDVKQRLICTLAALSEIGDEQALRNYIRAAIRVGLSQEEVKELFYHMTFYISLPHARRGKTLANDVFNSLQPGLFSVISQTLPRN